jgi:hypothetical protein
MKGRTTNSAQERVQAGRGFAFSATDCGAAPPAFLADKPRLDVGQPQIVGPAVGAEGYGMAAMVVGAVDQDAANDHIAHLAEGDLLRSPEGFERGGTDTP